MGNVDTRVAQSGDEAGDRQRGNKNGLSQEIHGVMLVEAVVFNHGLGRTVKEKEKSTNDDVERGLLEQMRSINQHIKESQLRCGKVVQGTK